MLTLIRVILLLLLSIEGLAQSTVTINGYVTDAQSGEKLIGATVYLPQLNKGTATNSYGFYSFTVLSTDSLRVVYSYVGLRSNRGKP